MQIKQPSVNNLSRSKSDGALYSKKVSRFFDGHFVYVDTL